MRVDASHASKVSVVVPAYNAEATIGAAIESVLAQTYSNLEIVIADDASTDSTAERVQAFDDPRVRLVQAAANGGEGSARDLAIANATGEWLAVIDADDCWLPERLEMLLSQVPREGDRWMIVDNIMQCYDVDGELRQWQPLWADGDVPGGFVDFLALPSHLLKPLFPRRVVTDLNLHHSDSRFGADAEFFIRAIKGANLNLRFIPTPMYLYRLTTGSMSTFVGKHALKRDLLRRLLLELDFSRDETEALKRHIAVLEEHMRYEPFLTAARQGQYARALKALAKDPALVVQLVRRSPASLRYRLMLKTEGGNSR
ncbi:MAG: glycosyltransferase family 2 protein [Pseudomonadota bacterium]